MGKLPLLNSLSKSARSFFFALMNRLKLIWGLVIQCAVRPLSIIKSNVGINAFHKLPLGCVMCTIDLFPFHGCEKGLHDGIVMGLSGLGERLDNLVHPKQLTKCF